MSRKRGKKAKAAVEAIPDDILAEGSGPVGRVQGDAIATVEDVVTTDDIATTEDVVTADDVVATADPDVSTGGAGEAGAAPEGLEPDRDDRDAAGNEEADDADDAVRCAPGEAAPDFELAGDDDDATVAAAPGADAEEDAGDGDEDDAAIVFPTSAATMDAVQLKHLVEALIFASDRPLTVPRLRQLTRVGDVRRLEQALAELSEDYRERGLVLQQVSGGYQFRTRTQFSAWVQQLIEGRPVRLSRAQLETLAIIAYRQPITRPEIDDIRGVDSSATLKLLIDRMLIRVLGKREEVGRPMLYGTTKEFLDFFSLGDLRELPTLREYSELTAESRKVMSDRLGIGPDGGDGPGGGGPDGGDDGDGSGGSSDGGGDGGDGGGGGGGGGGMGGGGPPPGFDDGDGTISDDGGAPASASATELAQAVATFLSAADAVDRSNADPENGDDATAEAVLAEDLEAEAILAEDSELEAILAEDSELEAALAAASEREVAAALAAASEREVAAASESAAALAWGPPGIEQGIDERPDQRPDQRLDREGSPGEAPDSRGPADEDGRVDAATGWPSGSQRFAVIASIDDRPVERPVMHSPSIETSPHEGSHGEVATAAALHVEPAAE